MYIIINPFTNKPIQFSTFKDEDFQITDRNLNGDFETRTALCLEREFDLSLLEKTYDPNTGTFN
jgi:hypothetical protein